ncbi:MAG: hypothetical protein Q4B16_08670 [Bacteroidia bacterium]|nr:hypothetical protein [Bacteroidia bacterium]
MTNKSSGKDGKGRTGRTMAGASAATKMGKNVAFDVLKYIEGTW